MRAAAVIAVLACACSREIVGGSGEHDDDDASTSGGVPTTTDVVTTVATSSTSTSAAEGTATGGGSSDGASDDNDSSFLSYPDVGPWGVECDVWTNDCPPGEKCMPWANDGGSSWNATKCSPIAPDPKQPGEPCTVEGSGVSGEDDCDVASMCWNVDPETNVGECVAFCVGSRSDPQCEDPCASCAITGDGVVNLCLPTCDPVAQGCGDGSACYPITDGFACMPDASGPNFGGANEPCEYINTCDAGLFCANPDVVPGCEGSQGCCAPFCDPTIADPCPGAAPGVECVPWVDEPTAFEGCIASTPGACVLP